jgi:hypothetical protein
MTLVEIGQWRKPESIGLRICVICVSVQNRGGTNGLNMLIAFFVSSRISSGRKIQTTAAAAM